MTDQQHPITPPPELVEKWWEAIDNLSTSCEQQLATSAAQWGADQELEACCEWLKDPCAADMPSLAKDLQYSRRPKLPSLKEQALEALERQSIRSIPSLISNNDCDTIRRALEQLND